MNKIQKIIIGIGILAFAYIGFSHYYDFQLDGWLNGEKKCIAERKELRKGNTGRLYSQSSSYLDRRDKVSCEKASRFVVEKHMPLRHASIGETFFSYITITTVLVLLLLLTKDKKSVYPTKKQSQK